MEKNVNAVKHTPGPNLLDGLTDKQLAMRPMCSVCGWRKGGIDSWDGARCKCGHNAPTFRQLFTREAEHHETEEAERRAAERKAKRDAQAAQ